MKLTFFACLASICMLAACAQEDPIGSSPLSGQTVQSDQEEVKEKQDVKEKQSAKEKQDQKKQKGKADNRSAAELRRVLLQNVHRGNDDQVPALAEKLHQHSDVSGADLMAIGEAWFGVGQMDKAVAAYDEVLKRYPSQKPHLWQRGLALYYNNEFERAVDQFNSHQTLGTSDIENSVWHLMSNARLKPLEEARKELIPNPGETRPVMHSVYDLFAGTGSPETVLAAAGYVENVNAVNWQVYHGLLYVALYHEMAGEKEASLIAMKKALKCVVPGQGLMSLVAPTHVKLRSGDEAASTTKK